MFNPTSVPAEQSSPKSGIKGLLKLLFLIIIVGLVCWFVATKVAFGPSIKEELIKNIANQGGGRLTAEQKSSLISQIAGGQSASQVTEAAKVEAIGKISTN